jgi:hypothetical protein
MTPDAPGGVHRVLGPRRYRSTGRAVYLWLPLTVNHPASGPIHGWSVTVSSQTRVCASVTTPIRWCSDRGMID